LNVLSSIEGEFALSGYPTELYRDWGFKHGYTMHAKRIDNKASSKKTKDVKTECLWVKR
jgi:hypothetical protein